MAKTAGKVKGLAVVVKMLTIRRHCQISETEIRIWVHSHPVLKTVEFVITTQLFASVMV